MPRGTTVAPNAGNCVSCLCPTRRFHERSYCASVREARGALLTWQGAAAPGQDGGCLPLPSRARSSHVRHTTRPQGPPTRPTGPQGPPATPAHVLAFLPAVLATLSH